MLDEILSGKTALEYTCEHVWSEIMGSKMIGPTDFENKTNIVIMIFIYGQSIITEIPNTSIKEKEEKIYEMGGG